MCWWFNQKKKKMKNEKWNLQSPNGVIILWLEGELDIVWLSCGQIMPSLLIPTCPRFCFLSFSKLSILVMNNGSGRDGIWWAEMKTVLWMAKARAVHSYYTRYSLFIPNQVFYLVHIEKIRIGKNKNSRLIIQWQWLFPVFHSQLS